MLLDLCITLPNIHKDTADEFTNLLLEHDLFIRGFDMEYSTNTTSMGTATWVLKHPKIPRAHLIVLILQTIGPDQEYSIVRCT
jgi:hypothetical protein